MTCPAHGYRPTTQEYLADPGVALGPDRARCPVFHAEELGLWVTTRHEGAKQALGSWQTFSSHLLRPLRVPDDLAGRLPDNPIEHSLLNADPPQHNELRRKSYTAFRPQRIAALEPEVRETARELLRQASGGPGDLMQQFCYPLMWSVVPRHLGLPPEDWQRFSRWKDTLIALLAASRRPDVDDAELRPHFDELAAAWDYFGRHVEQRRQQPTGDFASEMLSTTDGNPAFTTDRLIYAIFEAMSAGVTTTANLIGAAVLALDAHPEQRAALIADRALIPNAIEETLRRYPTATQVVRLTTEDVDLDGVTFPAQSMVAVSTASANLDERVFEDPERFDIHRANAKDHVAFGFRTHFCAGAPLARLAARVALEELYAHYPEVRVDDQDLAFRPIVNHWWLDHVRVDWGTPEHAG